MNSDRTKIGVHAQLTPQTEQPLLRPLARGGIVPAWTTDGAEQNSVGLSAKVDRLRRQWSAACIKRASADQTLAQLERMAVALCDRAENACAFGDDLRSD